MQTFPVICETCRAQLRVRSRRKIGEIHPCPKCGGMVLIQPPSGWDDTPSEESAAFAAMRPASSPKPQVPIQVGSSFREVGDLSGIDLDTPAGSGPSAETPTSAVEQWGSRLVWGSVAGSAAIVAASLVWALWPSSDEPRLAAAPSLAADSPVSGEEPADEESLNKSTTTVVNKPEVKPESAIAEPTSEEFDLPEPPPPVQNQAPANQTPEPETSETESPAENEVANLPLQPGFDPRDVDPENLDLILRKNSADPPVPAANAGPDEQPPADPRRPVVEGSDDLALARLENALAEAAKDARPETVRRGPTSADDLEPLNTDQLLQVVIPEIETPRISLHRAVEMLSDLTAIPITLDPAALRMAGISVNQEVSIRGNNATAAELIRTTLAEAKLQYEQRGNQLIVIRPGAEKFGSRTYRVEDLLPQGARDASSIAQLIQTLVSAESWKEQGGQGTIKVDQSQLSVFQSQAVHYDALILCERLRKARGLPLQSRYPEKLLRTKPLDAALASQLDRNTTFSFVVWTPLPRVIHHWEKATGLTILVDWSALADVQLAPNSTIACAVEGIGWREALDEVLTPLGLAWIPVDEKTIQITSRAAAEAEQFIEFYTLPKSSDAAEIVEQVKQQIPDGSVILDSVSRLLLVRANAAGQRAVAMQLSLSDE